MSTLARWAAERACAELADARARPQATWDPRAYWTDSAMYWSARAADAPPEQRGMGARQQEYRATAAYLADYARVHHPDVEAFWRARATTGLAVRQVAHRAEDRALEDIAATRGGAPR